MTELLWNTLKILLQMSDFNYILLSGFLVLRNYPRSKIVCWNTSNLISLYMTCNIIHSLTLTSPSRLISCVSTPDKTKFWQVVFAYICMPNYTVSPLFEMLFPDEYLKILFLSQIFTLNRHLLKALFILPLEFEDFVLVFNFLLSQLPCVYIIVYGCLPIRIQVPKNQGCCYV